MSSPLPDEPGAFNALVELVGYRLSTATVLYHAAIAEQVGVGATDMKCYSILRQSEPLTAGDLAERASLTSGAITGVIDRLEKAGLVRRAPDPHDRRRVVVELLHEPERERAINQLYVPLGQAITGLLLSYSEAERDKIGDFLAQATAILEAETRRLRLQTEEKTAGQGRG